MAYSATGAGFWGEGIRPLSHRDWRDQAALVFEPRFARNGRGAPDTIAPPLKAQNGGTGKGGGAPVVAFEWQNGSTSERTRIVRSGEYAQIRSNSIDAVHDRQAGVRRLTPTECERLQGFPDNWTDGQADSHRYRQLGNAVAVPVAEWIGRQIMAADLQE